MDTAAATRRPAFNATDRPDQDEVDSTFQRFLFKHDAAAATQTRENVIIIATDTVHTGCFLSGSRKQMIASSTELELIDNREKLRWLMSVQCISGNVNQDKQHENMYQ